MEYQTTLPASWEIYMTVKKQWSEPDMEQQTGSKNGKGVCQGYILSPCLFNLYAGYIMRNAGLDEVQAGIKIAGRNISNFRYADDTTFSYLEPVCCSISYSNCFFLTCIQISQEAGQVLWYSQLFQNFPQFIVIHTVKGFGIVNKAEIDVFLELSCFFNDPMHVDNLISGSSAFFKSSFRKFTVHVLLKPDLENFEHYFTSVWNDCNCVIVWAFFGIAFLWDWNENWPFPVLWPLLSFPNLQAYWV